MKVGDLVEHVADSHVGIVVEVLKEHIFIRWSCGWVEHFEKEYIHECIILACAGSSGG